MSYRGVAEPADLKRLAAAFNEAWCIVGSSTNETPIERQRQRAQLAKIVMEVWNIDPDLPLVTLSVECFGARVRLH